MAMIIGKPREFLRNQATYADLKIFLIIVFLVALSVVGVQVWPVLQPLIPPIIAIAILLVFLLILLFLHALRGSLETTSGKFDHGRRGEAAAEDILRHLPDQYFVFRDVIIGPFGNIDYAVIGPNGVFVVEVKHHVGRIAFDGTALTRNGRPMKEKDLLKQATSQSFRLREYLEGEAGVRVFVTAILLFTNPRAILAVESTPLKNVHVVGPRMVGQVIAARSGALDQQQLTAIIAALRNTVRE